MSDDRSRDAFRRAMAKLTGEAAALRTNRAEVDDGLRRARGEDEFRLVKAETKDISHEIALGAVLSRRGLRADDSWKLDGLLSLGAEEFMARFKAGSKALPGKAVGAILVRVVDQDGDALHQRGRAAAWRRKFKNYWQDYIAWLNADRELREQGAWRQRMMSDKQAEVIRVTCTILEIDVPGNMLRGAAHDWIEHRGAIIRYRWRS